MAPKAAKYAGPGRAGAGALSIAFLDPDTLHEATRALGRIGADASCTSDAAEFVRRIETSPPDAVVVDITLLNPDLLEALEGYRAKHRGLIYMAIDADCEAVEPTPEIRRLGVEDYLKKPIDPARLVAMAQTSLGRPPTGSTELALIPPLVTRPQPYFIFRSPKMREALRDLDRIAASRQGVLITGETGTGKELVARAIHVLGHNAEAPFVAINCGAVPEHLIEDELFGHERGAFTGAHRTRRGRFEAAGHGTLFLDEIGDMPLPLQVKLLRVLEEHSVYRIGGERPIPLSARVVAATQVDIERAVEDKLFREDLYYRLNVLRIHIPPLRERPEDIPLLAVHFLDRALHEQGRAAPYPELSQETIALLEAHPWRGNVRELRNLMARVATLMPPDAGRVLPLHVQPHLGDRRQAYAGAGGPWTFPAGPGNTIAEVEARLIAETLRQAGDNRTRAARMLGISLRTLRRKLNEPKGSPLGQNGP